MLECDLDLPAEIAYKDYDKRREIELVMRYYKSACGFDEIRVQDDYSAIGSKFCDFLPTLLIFRLIDAFDKNRSSLGLHLQKDPHRADPDEENTCQM